jgi:hypothetical protein
VNITGFQLENKNQRFSLEAKEKIKMNSGWKSIEAKQKQNGNDYRVDRVCVYSTGYNGARIGRIIIGLLNAGNR